MRRLEQRARLSRRERWVLREAVVRAEQQGRRKRTEWRLITGAPGSGKTTVIERLSLLGWTTNPDPGREELKAAIASGTSAAAARSDYHEFQRRVIARVLRAMNTYDTKTPVFFDYGIAETLAFLSASELPWDQFFVDQATQFSFRKVFLMATVPLDAGIVTDTIRVESQQRRDDLHQLIGEIYRTLGDDVCDVPSIPADSRIKLIIDELDPSARGTPDIQLMGIAQ